MVGEYVLAALGHRWCNMRNVSGSVQALLFNEARRLFAGEAV